MSAKCKTARVRRLIEADMQKPANESWIKQLAAYQRKVKKFKGLEELKTSDAVWKHFAALS